MLWRQAQAILVLVQWGRRDWDAVVSDGLRDLAAGLTDLLAPDGWTRVDPSTSSIPSVLLLHKPVDDLLVGTLEVDQTSFAGPYPFPFTLTADLGFGLAKRTPAFALATMEPIASQYLGPSAPFEVADRRGFERAGDGIATFVRSEEGFLGEVNGPSDVDHRLRNEIAARLAGSDDADRDRTHYLALLRLLLLTGFASREVILDVLAEYDGLPDSEYQTFAQAMRQHYGS